MGEKEEQMVVDKDLSKIKELSDDQLVEACGGLTANKGGRHGLNMKAKMGRIAEAEREFLAKYGGGAIHSNSDDTQKIKKKKKRKHHEVDENIGVRNEVETKKKRKKKDKCLEKSCEISVSEIADSKEIKKKKKKRKKSTEDL